MGLLSDFFIADRSTIPQYSGGEDFDALDKCQGKGLSPLQAGQLLAVLRGCEYNVAMIKEFKLVSPEDADDWTMTIPQDMVDKLAAIQPEQVAGIAAQFATATKEELGWSTDVFIPVVGDLSNLARRAIVVNKAMYLWNCV